MRLFFDQNLSPRLKGRLADLYPDSVHISDVGLATSDDLAVWAYARDHGLTIVSKDSDFRQLSFTFGHPPKVVWIRRGNCSTSEIELVLRERHFDLLAFIEDDVGTFLALS